RSDDEERPPTRRAPARRTVGAKAQDEHESGRDRERPKVDRARGYASNCPHRPSPPARPDSDDAGSSVRSYSFPYRMSTRDRSGWMRQEPGDGRPAAALRLTSADRRGELDHAGRERVGAEHDREGVQADAGPDDDEDGHGDREGSAHPERPSQLR